MLMARSVVKFVGVSVVVAIIAGCGGGAGEPGTGEPGTGEPAFVVPPEPASFADRAGTNQAPRADELAEVFVPRVMGRPEPLTADERGAAEASALELARDWLAANGFGADDDVVPTHAHPDEYGRVHVKMAQTHRGVPVIGAGLVGHLHPDEPDDVPDDVSENTVAGLSVDVLPVQTESAAIADAFARYGSRRGVVPLASARLAILPTLDLVRTGRSRAVDHTDDFERRLVDAHLVWEVVVEPEIPDLETVVLATLSTTPGGVDLDDAATDLARRENVTRGGNEEEEAVFEAFTTAITTPGVRYRFDASTGALLEEELLAEQDVLEESEGVGYGYFSGKVPLSTSRHEASNSYFLNDIKRPMTLEFIVDIGNLVWDAKNKATHDAGDMDLFGDGNDVWGDASILGSESSSLNSARRQTPAVDVAYAVQMTWDMFDHVLGRWGPSGTGAPTRACVHYDDGYTDAHFNRSSRFICFGDGSALDKPGNYSLATVGHELGHAFWHSVGNASKKGESSALNEGHGDVQGSLVAMYRGTGMGKGSQIRRFSNFANWRSRMRDPAGYSEEDDEGDTHTGLKYWSSSLKDKPEHVAGIPFGRMFIYLAEGAPDDPDSTLYTSEYPGGLGGIGITKAAHIWKTAVANYVVGTPTYLSMRGAFVHAAGHLYGAQSMERKAARRAFAAIRVGNGAWDSRDPSIVYAHVYAVNTTDMTALFWAVVDDDTGIRQLRVSGSQNHGVYTGDYLAGYANISRMSPGTRSFSFEVEDSAGRTDSVSRSFLKLRDRNLVANGDFEDDMDGWTTLTGSDRVSRRTAKAFIGERYATMEGLDSLSQLVTIPATAEDLRLVFRLLVRDSTKIGETLTVRVLSAGGALLETLATYDWETPKDGRNWRNKGYLRQAFDLDAYAGQTVRVAFVNLTAADKYRFLIDQVVLTYVEDVTVGVPQVSLHEWENTVAFRLPEIHGIEPNEILRVDYYVDNVRVAEGTHAVGDYYAASYLDDLGPGAHWVGGRVRALDNSILADTQGVWFLPKPVNELLVNPGFEDGAWDLIYSDPPPKVEVVENFIDFTIAFEGFRALKMGDQGTDTATEAGQAVQMPHQMKTLDFSVRLRIVSEEDDVDDEIWLELWNLGTFQKIAEFRLASFFHQPDTPGIDDYWRRYFRKNVSIPPHLVNGKQVLLRLRTKEDNGKPTRFYVDNASLRYTLFGLQLGG